VGHLLKYPIFRQTPFHAYDEFPSGIEVVITKDKAEAEEVSKAHGTWKKATSRTTDGEMWKPSGYLT
jgi:hypothetical protein